MIEINFVHSREEYHYVTEHIQVSEHEEDYIVEGVALFTGQFFNEALFLLILVKGQELLALDQKEERKEGDEHEADFKERVGEFVETKQFPIL